MGQIRSQTVRLNLQKLARAGALRLRTENGPDVSMASTADIWGEGPNVVGFQATNRGRPVDDVVADLRRAGMRATEANRFVEAAEAWAEARA